MAFKNITIDKKDGIGTIKINRPQVLNALNKDTMLELSKAVDDLGNVENRDFGVSHLARF